MRRVRRCEDASLEVVTMCMNASQYPLPFILPPPAIDRIMLIDSANPQAPESAVGGTIQVQARSVTVIAGTGPVA